MAAIPFAQRLLGRTLPDGWQVIDTADQPDGSTGGCFSVGYLVQRDNTVGYLKAMDFTGAFISSDPARSLQPMTQAFNFERDLCYKCAQARMSRVVHAIADGKVQIEDGNPFSQVQYLVFERADGDVRLHLSKMQSLDAAWALRTLHQIAVGLKQLHESLIAHQDLKPSNVLVFSQFGSKLGDLGSAVSREQPAHNDNRSIPGDRTYAPPELLYGYVSPEWNTRRVACDLYLLGSMASFFFTRAGMTALILERLDGSHHPQYWQEEYAEVLPYLRYAFGEAVQRVLSALPMGLRDDFSSVFYELCDPDPTRRGCLDGTNRRRQYCLHRYVSKFDWLASRAERQFAGD